MGARKKRASKTPRVLPPPGDAAIITADFLLTASLPVLSTLIAEVSHRLMSEIFSMLGELSSLGVSLYFFNLCLQAAIGDVRSRLSELAQIDIPSEWLFIALILIMLMFLAPLSQWLGGGMFNLCDIAALFVSGGCQLRAAIQRSAAQVAGALAGAYAAYTLFPQALAQRGEALVATTQPGVDVIGGASSEFLLTYLLSLIVLATQRTNIALIRYWVPLIATAAALWVGSRYSGPILNPAVALSWTFLHWTKQPLGWLQHVIIFWIAPVSAAVLAKWTDLGMQGMGPEVQKTSRPKKD